MKNAMHARNREGGTVMKTDLEKVKKLALVKSWAAM